MVSSLLARCIIVTIGTLYPGYRSYKSLITSDLRGVVDCLRYWIVFSIFLACETITDLVLSWFPFYYWIKIVIVFWIVSPSGSTFLYKRFIQPLLKEREQEIDQLIEQTRQKSYSAILDLTNKGFRYASNVFLNTAVLGQTYLGEHLKRSLSTSDISNNGTKTSTTPPATLYEESEEGLFEKQFLIRKDFLLIMNRYGIYESIERRSKIFIKRNESKTFITLSRKTR
ncbi:hypothetical protein I4U23_025506 [Adineta vaga]|nr:hypothetical protein I4U23_025506 [Adineta vaga]